MIAAVSGRLLGLPELGVLGTVGLLLLAVSWLTTWLRTTRPGVERRVRPRRVMQGQSVEIVVELRPLGRRPLPTSLIHDAVDGTALPTQSVAPIRVGSSRVLRTVVEAGRRGIARIGPLSVTVIDPLGLTASRQLVGALDEIVVWPRVETLSPLIAEADSNSESAPVSSLLTAPTVDDAPRLREYQPGDDVRRVHWPSTARLGSPIVREVDRPSQRRTIVVLDVRRTNHDGPSFERALSAAASVIVDRVRHDEPARLLTTSGVDTSEIIDQRGVEQLLDLLAATHPEGRGTLRGVLRSLAVTSSGATLVGCVGRRVDAIELATFGEVGVGSTALLVSCGEIALTPERLTEVRFGPSDDLAKNWSMAMRSRAGSLR